MKRVFALLFLLIFSHTTKAFAGGGLIDFTVEPTSPVQPGEYYLITANVYTDVVGGTPCKDCKVQFVFNAAQKLSGGTIIPFAEKTDDKGHITAKVINTEVADRYIQAIATLPDNTLFESSFYILTFGNPFPSPTDITTTNMQKATAITAVSQSLSEGAKNRTRRVSFKWNGSIGMYDYYLYFMPLTENSAWGYSGEPTTYPYATIEYLSTDIEHDIKVQTCPKGSTIGCVDSESIRLGVYDENHPDVIQTKELNNRIANLEAKVNQTEKKQSFLEAQITNILSFLKRIFPFWK